MKFTTIIATLVGFLASSGTITAQECATYGFVLEFTGTCNYETVLEAYTDQVYDMGGSSSCSIDVATDLQKKLDVAGVTVKDVCDNAFTSPIPFSFAAKRGTDMAFEQHFFNGRSDWQEEVETKYDSDDGTATSILSEDASQVNVFYEATAQSRAVEWPGILPNFRSSVTDANGQPTCESNAAMCCWPKDRQANDNNGNCARAYDENCVDKDPADNTDLCYIGLDRGRGANEFGSELGLSMYPRNDANGEGAIHCHGLAWADDAADTTARYKGNNLFYVSMYDHMHQRGYVENIPGSSMCGCVEQMPAVSRSDCTQVDVTESYRITFDSSTSTFGAKITNAQVNFNACQGENNRNNDLYAYMARLYREGKLAADKFGIAGRVITDTGCLEAEQSYMSDMGYSKGYNHDITKFTQVIGRDSLSSEMWGPEALKTAMTPAEPIFLRVCVDCDSTHQTIYYKRKSVIPDSFDLLHNLAYQNNDGAGNNRWNEDFTMHSTLEDALSGANPWKCPGDAYNYRARFPGECSPSGARVRNQGSNFGDNNSRKNVSFYVYKPEGEGLQVVPSDAISGYWGGGQALEAADGTIYLTGRGRDIWDRTDDFNFYSNPLTGDHTITVKISSFRSASRDQWMKAGIMMRTSLDPKSPHVAILLSGNNRVHAYVRTQYDGPTTLPGGFGAYFHSSGPPVYLRLEKRATTYNFKASFTGDDWVQFTTVDVPQDVIGDSYFGGLAACSKRTKLNVEAVFEDLDIDLFTFPSAAPTISMAPTSWVQSRDIGAVGRAGSAIQRADGSFTITASGSDIWQRRDEFHYVYFQKSGDVTVTMKVSSLDYNNNWAKAGIMVRDNFDDNAAFFSIYTAGYQGIANQWRMTKGNTCGNSNTGSKGTHNVELKITKVGRNLTSYYRVRGEGAWIRQGTTRAPNFSDDGSFYVGIALTSHNNWYLATLEVENFVMS